MAWHRRNGVIFRRGQQIATLARELSLARPRIAAKACAGTVQLLLRAAQYLTTARETNHLEEDMVSVTLKVNGEERSVPADSNGTLQFALRDDLGLTGTKFGCGQAQCGCCTVLMDGQPVRSCVTSVTAAAGKDITTIEGLGSPQALHPLQQAWIDVQAPQCGYCQSGQIMEAAALLQQNPSPTEDQIKTALNGHICRCGTYNRIVQAVQLAATRMNAGEA